MTDKPERECKRCKELEAERDRLEDAVARLTVELGNARTELEIWRVPELAWWVRAWRWIWRRP